MTTDTSLEDRGDESAPLRPTAARCLEQLKAEERPARGCLIVYLGAAPGVGKTYAMLHEGRRLKAEGTDVIVGFVETHGRAETEAVIGDLEVVPASWSSTRGSRSRRWTLTPC
jgi:two-component system sensor histidine kinase KdpD